MPYHDYYPPNLQKKDPLETQPLKLPVSATDIFRVQAAKEQRQLTFLYRRAITQVAEEFFANFTPAEKKALLAAWKKR